LYEVGGPNCAGNRELQPVNLDRTLAVVATRTGDVFMRGVAVNDRR
jgi:hypothetical protein